MEEAEVIWPVCKALERVESKWAIVFEWEAMDETFSDCELIVAESDWRENDDGVPSTFRVSSTQAAQRQQQGLAYNKWSGAELSASIIQQTVCQGPICFFHTFLKLGIPMSTHSRLS